MQPSRIVPDYIQGRATSSSAHVEDMNVSENETYTCTYVDVTK